MDRRALLGLARDWGIALAIALVGILLWRGLQPAPATEGAAPALTAPFVDGRSFDLHDRSASVYVVNFWATWCGPCRKEIPHFSAFAKAHPEVELYGVSVDTNLAPAQLEAASRRLGIDYPVLHDANQTAAGAWGVSSFPTTFVLDQNHNIRSVRVGMVDGELLERLVAEAR